MLRQLSVSACVEGRSWQSQPGQVYVGNGCRAEFAAREGAGNYSVTCRSDNNGYNTCAWDSRKGRPVLIQQLSKISCREGYSWGYLGTQVWVSRGCQARFGAR